MLKSNTPPYILTFLVCLLLWLLLTASFDKDGLIAGLVLSFFVSILSAKYLLILNGLIISPSSIIPFLSYLFCFIKALIRANFDLAGRIVAKKIPIDPGFIEVKTSMQSDLGKLLLANSITLTPGTLTIDVYQDSLLVHWIDCPEDGDIKQATQAIVSDFEKDLKGFLK